MLVKIMNGRLELTTTRQLEGFDQMAQRRSDVEINRRLWLPKGIGCSSIMSNGLELSNVGVGYALQTTVDGKRHAILARRITQDGEHLMLPSSYIDFSKVLLGSEEAPHLSSSGDIRSATESFAGEGPPRLAPRASAQSRIKEKILSKLAGEVCLLAGDQEIITSGGKIFYPESFDGLNYLPNIWSTLKVENDLPPFIHNYFKPLGVSLNGVELSGVGFQMHMHTNSGQLIFGGVYSIGLDDLEDRSILSLAHAEDRLVGPNDNSPRARQLKQMMKSPLETVVDKKGLLLCELDERGQLTPNLFNLINGARVRHPLDWNTTTLSDSFVPGDVVGSLGFSSPEGASGFVDRVAFPALEYFKEYFNFKRSGFDSYYDLRTRTTWRGISMPDATGFTAADTPPAITQIRSYLRPFAVTDPNGFYSLPAISVNEGAMQLKEDLMQWLDRIRGLREINLPVALDLSQTPHQFIYNGIDYHHEGPVIVGPSHISRIFSKFEKPSDEEVQRRVLISKEAENYGTMPGVETAYAGAIVKALQPRIVLIIGEHKGILTEYLAQQAPQDCVFVTMDLPKSMYGISGVRCPNQINASYVRHSDDQIGEKWRTGSGELGKRILGFLGDSTHQHSAWLFEALRDRCDLVVVDGNHELYAVRSDLLKAWDVLTTGGVVLIDDFYKPPRLHAVASAVDETRRYLAAYPFLYHVSWGQPGPDVVTSNLAFLIKGPDPGLSERRDDMLNRLQDKATRSVS
jgi:predicted O-methyltransferase YrrM